MQVSNRVGRGALCALGLGLVTTVAVAISSRGAGTLPPAILATAAPGQFGGSFGGTTPPNPGPDPAPKVHIQAPVSAAAARVWAILDQPIDLPFPHETSLGEVIQHLKQATASDDHKSGIPIYVDPVGLTEAEQTLDSPVVIDLEGIALRTSLGLLLSQLDLVYEVHPEGLLIVTGMSCTDRPITDPSLQILDELRRLREEVHELKSRFSPAARGGGGFQ